MFSRQERCAGQIEQSRPNFIRRGWIGQAQFFTVHLPNGFSSIKLESVTAAGAHFGQPGYETDLLYLAALVALVLGGSGPFALDRYLFRSWAGHRTESRPAN
jgi:hypothetical protein